MKKIYCFLITLLMLLSIYPTQVFNALNADEKFKLEPLPYSYDALEPFIDKETMKIHHDKHHQTYVDNLNKALSTNPEYYSKDLTWILTNLDSVPKEIRQNVINNAGGVYNHNFFWTVLAPKSGGTPTGELSKAINRDFGSFDNFKAEFKKAALGQFGSGWAWLVSDKDGKLSIISTSNQDSPISKGLKPLLTIDVWEHAYYLKYQNKRADYIDNMWNIINWPQVEKYYNS